MKHFLPVEKFEELIGLGLWVGHEFDFQGSPARVISISQAETVNGQRVIPIEIEYEKTKIYR